MPARFPCWFAAFPILAGLAGIPLAAAELEPIAPGPFPVATTNLEVTPLESGPMFSFLNGKMTANGTQYLTDILVHPEAVPILHIDVPANAALFGKLAGTRLPVVLLIVYPTTADNPRGDYTFPYKETGDAVFTRMQRPGDKPVFDDPTAKHPLILFSGGYNTHGLWHLWHMKALAAHGYIVVDLFHGDGRNASLSGSLALRSLQLRAALDFLLQHPDFGPAIDADRIGATGESAGGHTVAAALGGIDPAGKMPADADDPRIKAGFGLVPFLGGSLGFWPFKTNLWLFGEDHAGLQGVRRPFLAVYGAKDGNVPPAGVEGGIRAMSGPATAIVLDDEGHALSNSATSDIRTWEILFFNTWLRDDTAARKQLATGMSVRGGVTDHKTIQQAGKR